MKSFVIGITGGSASGKSTLARMIRDRLGNAVILSMDMYYRYRFKRNTIEEIRKTNFDSPRAIDLQLFRRHLKLIIKGKAVKVPVYSFVKHRKIGETTIQPAEVVIVEGLFVLYDRTVRNLLDLKIFLDVSADIRLIRRIKRDMKERGRTLDYVFHQWINFVRPGHEKYVEPTKRFADIIVEGYPKVPINKLVREIRKKFQQSIREKIS